ncbi:heat shock protein DnaJ domain-containing protein [Halosimplex carlsbadense 2-9-1]|uniref:Heat shock protein DnaJ domain-containing protein n=1 Tax=Halosimplex carlsbadense 2-9-1 TaxID=797114 RepID=M0CPM5_9EURY|nr:DnaJ domain-containing protein [Halosimplex carlsbadense]ELZ24347.1 heat shock protein DnaJ domain-containing protein [Halosimplex carlsbadense 2-9-1]
MTETFYDRLGIDADATTEEIEDAYREAIKRVHPDVSDDVDAGERTKRLNEAKRVLTDGAERARYDRLGHAAYTGEGTPDAGSTRTAAGSGDTGSGSAPESDPGSGSATTASRTGESGTGGPSSDTATGTDRSGRDGNTWRGSQQRGRRSGAGRSAGGTDRHRRERTRGRGRADGRGTAGEAADGTTRSTGGSTGPSWQSSGAAAGAGGAKSGSSPSARRQAAAGASNGPNVDWSWNAWDATGAWAVRNGPDGGGGLRLSRLFPVDQSVVLLVSTFVCYPFFVAATLFPAFPLVARATVGVCTLLTFAYLLSIPEVAILVFGLWSVVVPILLLAVPGLAVFSLAGVIGLTATWVPLGMSVLTFTLVRS